MLSKKGSKSGSTPGFRETASAILQCTSTGSQLHPAGAVRNHGRYPALTYLAGMNASWSAPVAKIRNCSA